MSVAANEEGGFTKEYLEEGVARLEEEDAENPTPENEEAIKKAEFYNFVRSLDAAKASLTGKDNVLILGPDSPLAQIFYSDGSEPEAPATPVVAVQPAMPEEPALLVE